MKFESLVPILYATDLEKSIAYYRDQLAFDRSWIWDEEKTFGGASLDCVEIFFCKLAQGNPGTWLAINVDNIDEYHDMIKTRGAEILSIPEDKPWNMREMLVRDPDGHIIRFGTRIGED
jgi:catechol 2,3-dioxygenase-like lactoylglutathione lyase family enzyme